MNYFFGESKPTETQILMGMVAEQSKQIHALTEEIKNLSAIVETLQDNKIKPLELPPTLHIDTENLWEKNIIEEDHILPIDEIYRDSFDNFINGECLIDEEDYTEVD